jgi:chemotaxis protein CheX
VTATTSPLSHEALAEGITAATLDVFSTMLGLPLEVEEVSSPNAHTAKTMEVVGVVGLSGSVSGSGAFICGPKAACQIAASICPGEYTSVDETVLDAIGEMANLVIGYIKTKIEDQIGAMGLSVPTVVYGSSFGLHYKGGHPFTVVRFRSGDHIIWVQITLDPEGKKTRF